MTEAIGRGIIAGIDQTKPELLELLLKVGEVGSETVEEFGSVTKETFEHLSEQVTAALLEGRLMMRVGSENFGVLCNTGITTAGAVIAN